MLRVYFATLLTIVTSLFGCGPALLVIENASNAATPSAVAGSLSPGHRTSEGHESNQTTADASTVADAEQSAGLVLVNTTIDWGLGTGAGTGMVVDASGLVVTNHHVVQGSTSISVTDSAGNTYKASVVGYDTTDDVAVLQLGGASGLATITADTTLPSIGASITAVGNSQGGGQFVAAPGQVTDTGVDITVRNDDGSQSYLSDLIQMDANIVPGDSGGAVYDTSGEVVGMNVAGSEDPNTSVSYSIPMGTVITAADDIAQGKTSATITTTRGGALGVTVGRSGQIVGVVSGGAADKAGITAGSTITKVDGQTIADQTQLAATLAQYQAGDKVQVSWSDSTGATHKATVTLQEAPLP